MDTDRLITLTNMTSSEFKQYGKAIRVLLAVGMDQITAMQILLDAAKMRQQEKRNAGMRK